MYFVSEGSGPSWQCSDSDPGECSLKASPMIGSRLGPMLALGHKRTSVLLRGSLPGPLPKTLISVQVVSRLIGPAQPEAPLARAKFLSEIVHGRSTGRTVPELRDFSHL